MSIKRSHPPAVAFAAQLLSFVLLLDPVAFVSVAQAVYSLPPSRVIKWQGNVGVKGDIPVRTTIYRTLTPSGGNDAPAIQGAIAACPPGKVVQLSPGAFSISSPVTVKSGVTLRGAGMGVTIIKGAPGMTGRFLLGFNSGSSRGASVSIMGGAAKGASTIATGYRHGWRAGDLLLIDQRNDPRGDPVVTNVGTSGTCRWCGRDNGTRALGQIGKVVAVPGPTTATLEMPLYWNYASKLNAQATRISGFTSNAGIEDLTVDNCVSASSYQSGEGATIAMYGNSNCWLLRVEAIGSHTNMIRVKNTYRNTIRGCSIHEGTPPLPETGGQYRVRRAYGIVIDYSSANLIEDNQIYHLTMGVAFRGPTSGNVVAYNYFNDMYYSDSLNWQTDSVAFHGGHPMMNLLEGNYVAKGRMCADYVWGSSSHNTFFRNRQALDTTRNLAAWDYSLYKYSTYYNFVGNVIGTTGFETSLVLQTEDRKQKAIYGFFPLPLATVLLHGNWDAFTRSVSWHGTDDRDLPASLYLSSKPGWWGNSPWPAIGPDVTPMYPAAPHVGAGTPWGASYPSRGNRGHERHRK